MFKIKDENMPELIDMHIADLAREFNQLEIAPKIGRVLNLPTPPRFEIREANNGRS